MTSRNPNGVGKGETPDLEAAHKFRVPLPRFDRLLRLPLLYSAAFLALSLVLFPPTQKKKSVRFEEGSIADIDIVAPFSFVVPLSDHDLELARARAAVAVPPVFVRDDGTANRLPGDLADLFGKIGAVAGRSGVSVRERVKRMKEIAPELRNESIELLADGGIRERMLKESLRLQARCLERGIVNDASALRQRDYARITVIAE
ncbi:MAG: hypothetical protein WC674_01120, partial [Candidatus Krumholzibacteriia bacterium]